MRHRRRGRTLGRSPSHRRALLRNLASSLFLTERDDMFYEGLTQSDGKTVVNPPGKKGRIVTTLHKAKEVRPLVEKCITIARKAIPSLDAADELAVNADRNSDEWRQWRKSEKYHQWNAAIAPAVAARRRVFQILRDKEAVEILFEEVAPRFTDRPGGYTRILRLAKPRLGDAGTQAILEFVGENDRVKKKDAQKPAFEDSAETDDDNVDESVEADSDEAPGSDLEATEPAVEEDTGEADKKD